jgi:hypothetical protein
MQQAFDRIRPAYAVLVLDGVSFIPSPMQTNPAAAAMARLSPSASCR